MWSVIEALPHYTGTASQGASQKLVAVGQKGPLSRTTSNGSEMEKTVVSIGESHVVALRVTDGQNVAAGGSGGARTRNLCRDRAAL